MLMIRSDHTLDILAKHLPSYSPDLCDLGASLADDASYELIGHGHLVSLGAGAGARGGAQLGAGEGGQGCRGGRWGRSYCTVLAC